MKGFLKSRFFTIIICVLVCVIGCSIYSYAANYSKEVPVTVTFKATAPGLTLYSDAAYQNELTSFEWGELTDNSSHDFTVYVKNTGNRDLGQITVTSTLDPSVGTVTLPQTATLARGQSGVIQVRVASVELLQDYTEPWSIIVSGTY